MDPAGSRASRPGSLSPELLTDETLAKIRALNEIAKGRGQSLAQMALAWTLRDPRMTSTLAGASSVAQLEANVAALARLDFTPDELAEIDRYATDGALTYGPGRATPDLIRSAVERPDGQTTGQALCLLSWREAEREASAGFRSACGRSARASAPLSPLW